VYQMVVAVVLASFTSVAGRFVQADGGTKERK
jgi:hypothetical protein